MGSKAKDRVGILPLARATFDVPYAEERFGAMLAALDATGHDVVGARHLLFDAAAARASIAELRQADIDRLLILQVTFTDALVAVEAANAFAQPLALWSIPEPRLGGRLRLNAFCGLNLAAHALGLIGRDFGYLHAAPDAADIGPALLDLLSGRRQAAPVALRGAAWARGHDVAPAQPADDSSPRLSRTSPSHPPPSSSGLSRGSAVAPGLGAASQPPSSRKDQPPQILGTRPRMTAGEGEGVPDPAPYAVIETSEAGRGQAAAASLRGARIARIGNHPDGFDTCRYDPAQLASLSGASVDDLDLDQLFEAARAAPESTVAPARRIAQDTLAGLRDVDQDQLERSLRLKAGLDALRQEGGYDAFAIRCWPETFTEYGGAVCGPVAMMGEARTPCACEADVYGALTSLLLQRVADAPAFLTDLVDVDEKDDTAVVWHCGQAPLSMADPDAVPRATIHTNRTMPLLQEFPLKPGRVTFFRISQARGRLTAVIGGATMLKRPMSFTGTSGVVRFDAGTATVLDTIMGAALEHHMALAYGDHRNALEAAAGSLGLPVLDL